MCQLHFNSFAVAEAFVHGLYSYDSANGLHISSDLQEKVLPGGTGNVWECARLMIFILRLATSEEVAGFVLFWCRRDGEADLVAAAASLQVLIWRLTITHSFDS